MNQEVKSKRGESQYAKKRRSGNMMYGPMLQTPKFPDLVLGRKKVMCECHTPPMRYNICEAIKAGANPNMFNEFGEQRRMREVA